MKTIRRPISILLAVLMVVGMFTMVPISAGAATWTFKLNSNFSGEWNADTDVVSEQPVELNLAAGDYEFQIIANDGTTNFYRGNEQAGSSTETYSQVMHDNGGNAKFHADGGKYTLTYNSGTGVLTINPVYVAQIDGTNYKTLEAAFAAAQDGETITLLANCAGNGIKVPQGKFANNGLTVDFAGFTYTVDGETVGSTGTETNGFQLLKGNNINFLNGTIYSEKAKILVQNYSNLGLYDMTLTLNNTSYNGAYTLSNNNGNAGIHNTTINANPAGGFAFDVCRYSSYPSINVEVTGNSVINGNVEIFASKGEPKDGFSLTLSGGTMNGDIVVDSTAQTAIENYPEKAVVTKTNSFTQTAPEGFEWVDNGQGVSTLVALPYAAKIGDTKYRTLEEAFAAAVDGDTITLLADSTGNGIKVPQGKFNNNGLTVDFVDYTYTIDGETVGSTGTETNGFQLLKDNKVTFKGGTIYSEKAKILVQNYSDLTLLGMTLTLDNPNYTSAYTLSNNNGDVVIDSTTINANPAGGFAFDVCRFSSYPSVNVTVTGGSDIQGDVEISASKGQAKDGFSLTLESGSMTGDIVVDASAQALVGEDNKVTKKDTFTKEAPAGFKWVSNEDGTASLAPVTYVAEVVSGNNVGNKYETVNDAVAAAGDNGEVKLIADITGNVGIGGVNTPYNTTLDLNGHTITNTSGSGITLYSQSTDPATFTIKDSSPEQTGGITITKKYPGDGCISDSSGRQVIIEGGTYTSNDKALYISSDEGWTINGGTFNGKIHVLSDVAITGGTFNGEVVQSSTYDYSTPYPWTEIPAEIAISGGTFDRPVPADFCADGYDPKDNGDDTYTVAPHEHDWDYENVTWNFTESASHSIYAKYTLTCKTDHTHTKEQTGSGTLMSTVAVDGDKFVYSHSAVKIDGNSVAVPNYTRNIADGIINRNELVAASKVAGEYKLANDITGFYDSVKPVDGFVLDGQSHMIKYGTMNANNRVMFVAADQNTKFTLKNITLDGNNKAKWAVCAYTGNSGNNAGNVITLDTVTIQNFKSNDYVGAINAFGSSTWNLKNCTITGNTTVDDSDGLSGSAVWAGSKATINIDGGTYDEVYLHSYSGTGAVLNADGGATIDNLVLDLTKTDTLKANIDEATVGAITSNEGTIPEEAVVMDPDKATVAAPEGYKWVDSDETGMKTLAQIVYVAQIGETKYETLEEAFAAAVDGDTIKVLADCAGNGIKVTPAGKFATGLTVDFDGHTYTVDGETVGSPGTETLAFQLLKNNKVTFKDGTIYSEKAKMLVQNYCDLTLDGMTLTLNNTSYNGAYTLSNNNGNVVINDTTINANPTTGSFAFDVCRYGKKNTYPSVNVTVTGESKINGNVEIFASNSDAKDGFSLNLVSGTMSGDIIVDPTAATAMANTPEKASVNKADGFDQDPAAGYKWKDNGDGTSTLVKADLFAGYGLTLQGDIGLIFYLDPAAMGIKADDVQSVSVSFTCDKYTGTVTDFTKSGDYIKVAYNVPAAYMASPVHAYSVTINDKTSNETDKYSVQQYALRIIADPEGCNIPAAKADAAKKLMKEMLNYGAKAKDVFQTQMQAPEAAVYAQIPNYTMASVSASDIETAIKNANGGKTGDDMSKVVPQEGAKFYTPSLIFLSESTLRLIFEDPNGGKVNGYTGNQQNHFYWVDKVNIEAANLDTLYTFNVNGVSFKYSALDYAKAVLESGNTSAAAKELVSAMYLYNQAANAYYI